MIQVAFKESFTFNSLNSLRAILTRFITLIFLLTMVRRKNLSAWAMNRRVIVI